MPLSGRIAGIAGITAGAAVGEDRGRRIAFVLGLPAAPLAWCAVSGGLPKQDAGTHLTEMAPAGLLVGVGTALGSGCTSGHGVCGLARLSGRSLATFTTLAAATLSVLRHRAGGGQ